jgi:hypothetical protein
MAENCLDYTSLFLLQVEYYFYFTPDDYREKKNDHHISTMLRHVETECRDRVGSFGGCQVQISARRPAVWTKVLRNICRPLRGNVVRVVLPQMRPRLLPPPSNSLFTNRPIV